MLFRVFLTSVLSYYVHRCEGIGIESNTCSFPLPLELPNRNDRADQCWIRIEDVELTETVTVFCYVAHAFLRNYIHDYNARKMTEDNVDVSLWSERARTQEDIIVPKTHNDKGLKDWKLTTIMDPVTHMRLYVTKDADCRLIMYSRDGMSNYKINCERILFYVNERVYGGAAVVVSRTDVSLLSASIFLVFASIQM